MFYAKGSLTYAKLKYTQFSNNKTHRLYSTFFTHRYNMLHTMGFDISAPVIVCFLARQDFMRNSWKISYY